MDPQNKKRLKRLALPLGVGALTYGALRRFSPSANPALKALQQANKGKGFSFVFPEELGMGVKKFSPLLGAGIEHEAEQAAGKSVARLYHNAIPSGGAAPGAINAGELPWQLGDKGTYFKHLKGAPTSAVLQHAEHASPEGVKKLVGDKFLVKNRFGSMGDVSGFVSESTPLTDPRWAEIAANPSEYVAQAKIPIDREYRVHLLNNEPFSPTHRRLPNEKLRKLWEKIVPYFNGGSAGNGGAFMPVMGDERKALMDFARQSASGMQLAPGEAVHQALDIARLPDGSFKVIESNPFPGTVGNPMTARKLRQLATGQWGRDVALAGGLGTAAATQALQSALGREDA